jgi:putative transposase
MHLSWKLCFPYRGSMRSQYKVTEHGGYFLTATIVEWLPVFTTAESCEIVVRALAHYREHNDLRVRAFVIMDNHIHLVAEAPNLPRVIQSFKSYTAAEIILLAERSNRDLLLNQFAYYRKKYKGASRYQVWQEGYHPQRIQGEKMLAQKVRYIHNNPVRR